MKPRSLVLIEWRDSFADTGHVQLSEHDEDCRWISVGWVVRTTDLFVTIAQGVQNVGNEGERMQLDNLLSIPWTQVVAWEAVA